MLKWGQNFSSRTNSPFEGDHPRQEVLVSSFKCSCFLPTTFKMSLLYLTGIPLRLSTNIKVEIWGVKTNKDRSIRAWRCLSSLDHWQRQQQWRKAVPVSFLRDSCLIYAASTAASTQRLSYLSLMFLVCQAKSIKQHFNRGPLDSVPDNPVGQRASIRQNRRGGEGRKGWEEADRIEDQSSHTHSFQWIDKYVRLKCVLKVKWIFSSPLKWKIGLTLLSQVLQVQGHRSATKEENRNRNVWTQECPNFKWEY